MPDPITVAYIGAQVISGLGKIFGGHKQKDHSRQVADVNFRKAELDQYFARLQQDRTLEYADVLDSIIDRKGNIYTDIRDAKLRQTDRRESIFNSYYNKRELTQQHRLDLSRQQRSRALGVLGAQRELARGERTSATQNLRSQRELTQGRFNIQSRLLGIQGRREQAQLRGQQIGLDEAYIGRDIGLQREQLGLFENYQQQALSTARQGLDLQERGIGLARRGIDLSVEAEAAASRARTAGIRIESAELSHTQLQAQTSANIGRLERQRDASVRSNISARDRADLQQRYSLEEARHIEDQAAFTYEQRNIASMQQAGQVILKQSSGGIAMSSASAASRRAFFRQQALSQIVNEQTQILRGADKQRHTAKLFGMESSLHQWNANHAVASAAAEISNTKYQAALQHGQIDLQIKELGEQQRLAQFQQAASFKKAALLDQESGILGQRRQLLNVQQASQGSFFESKLALNQRSQENNAHFYALRDNNLQQFQRLQSQDQAARALGLNNQRDTALLANDYQTQQVRERYMREGLQIFSSSQQVKEQYRSTFLSLADQRNSDLYNRRNADLEADAHRQAIYTTHRQQQLQLYGESQQNQYNIWNRMVGYEQTAVNADINKELAHLQAKGANVQYINGLFSAAGNFLSAGAAIWGGGSTTAEGAQA